MNEQQKDGKPLKPGRFTSPLKNYPGYVEFPHPVSLRHFAAWWKASIDDVSNKKASSVDSFVAEWYGARALILEFGDWGIKNVPKGDLHTEEVPMEVVSWVMEVCDDYLYPFLPRKKLRGLFTPS